jgi:pilus assembly protein Flp/PilA
MKHHFNQVNRFWQDEAGLELSEYAVAAALISIAVAGAFTSLGSAIQSRVSALTSVLA